MAVWFAIAHVLCTPALGPAGITTRQFHRTFLDEFSSRAGGSFRMDICCYFEENGGCGFFDPTRFRSHLEVIWGSHLERLFYILGSRPIASGACCFSILAGQGFQRSDPVAISRSVFFRSRKLLPHGYLLLFSTKWRYWDDLAHRF